MEKHVEVCQEIKYVFLKVKALICSSFKNQKPVLPSLPIHSAWHHFNHGSLTQYFLEQSEEKNVTILDISMAAEL